MLLGEASPNLTTDASLGYLAESLAVRGPSQEDRLERAAGAIFRILFTHVSNTFETAVFIAQLFNWLIYHDISSLSFSLFPITLSELFNKIMQDLVENYEHFFHA